MLEPSDSHRYPHRVMATFMGVTTISLDDGDTAIMTDGFFSRPSKWQLLTKRIAPNQLRIQECLARANVRELAAVFVAHSHHDHALDSATVASQTGATLLGSDSVANIASGEGFKNRFIEIADGHTYSFGKFDITPYKSPHSPHGFFRGKVTAKFRPPENITGYRGGSNYSFLVKHERCNLLIHPSANFRAGMFNDVRADVVFLGVGTLGRRSDEFAEAYWREVVVATRAPVVIPIHWDDFTVPLDEPLRPMPAPADNFERGLTRILRLASRDHVAVKFIPVFQPIAVYRALSLS